MMVIVKPIIVGELGMVPKGLQRGLEELEYGYAYTFMCNNT